MSTLSTGHLSIQLPLGTKSASRLEAQIRNGILSLMDITCPDHGSNTSLDAEIGERDESQITVELQACCDECAHRGEKAIQKSTAMA